MHLYYDPGTQYIAISRRKMKTRIYKNSCENVHSTLLHNSPKLEITVVYSSNENLSSNKEESQNHHAE